MPADSAPRPGGLWPMMRPGTVSGATRALRCRVWHEVVVVCRPRSALTRGPRVCRDAGSSVGSSARLGA
eukprot:3785113-Prymnesium_polylepis.1